MYKKVSKNRGYINNIKKIPKHQNKNKGLNNINAKKPKSKEINNIKKNTKDKENINNKIFFKNKSKSINLINKKGVNNKKVKKAIPLNIKNKSEKNFNTKSKNIIYQNNIIIEINNNKKLEKIYNNNTDERIVNIQKNLLESMPKKECELCHKQIYSHLYKIHYNTHATEIFNWLYLGTFENACDIEELKRIKATHILKCAIECINKNLASNIKELHLKIHDYKDFQLFDFFEKGNDFINKCKNEGVILVHCKYGISRSVSIIISYLIKYMGYSTDDAFDFVRKKRGQINPNEGFREQLYSYERNIKGEKEDKINNNEKIENENIEDKENKSKNVKKQNEEKKEIKEILENKENLEKRENLENKENIESKEIIESKKNIENKDNIENKENIDSKKNKDKECKDIIEIKDKTDIN